MSSSSSSPSTVSLYRYDLTQGMARSMGPMLIGRALEGIWHTSIVVFGKEYYFDGGVGIAADPNPGRTRFGQPYRTEVLGQTRKRHEEFFAWTQQQRSSGFGPNDYHLLNNNCNSFSDAASMFLLGRHIPQDVLEMIPTLLATPMGQMLRPMLEQATSGNPAGINTAPRAALPPPPPPLPATSAAQRTDTCVGLLSPHKSITEDDEEELMLAQAMLESNETIADGPRSSPDAFEKAISGLTLLQTVMGNICAHPTEAKYRALSMESNAYKTKLKPLEPYGVTDVLRIAGFVRRPHSSGGSGEQWYLSDAAGSAELLERVSEMLAMTISSIEGAAADAAKARATLAAGPTTSASQPANETAEGANSLKSPPLPDGSPDAAADASNFTNGNAGAASTVLRYCYPPFDKDWKPLSVGSEGGAPLFSIHCLPSGGGQDGVGAAGPLCFGKCRLSPNQQHLQAYYCSGDGREVEVRGGYEVLCVHRGQEDLLVWVPARMACAATSATPSRFIFSGYGRFGVARAEHGSGVQPGVMEPSGRCVIPYGGRAVVVTEKAEVLCERARLPASLAQALAELEKGVHLSQVLRAANGQPIGSFDELLHRWQPPTFYIPPAPLQPRTRQPASVVNCDGDGRRDSAVDDDASPSSPTSPFARGTASSVRLLVCHDFGGGYTAGERPAFVLEESGEAREERKTRTEATPMHKRNALVESAYTVGYWDRTDCFVYFSHQRISVPPRSWIHDGHRHGVTVLGTLITEGAGGVADLELLLTDAKRMALVIERLVQVCDVYGFDGYLVNIENKLPTNLAKRLLVFCTQLRKQLNCRASQRTARLVIWYDAVTTDGTLAYQNALTARNKPFFDVCDGLFTNYFWNPVHIAMTRAAAGSRGADVFVGVDVFGRRMFGGGGYNSYLAVEEAVHADLSVALFAPGWTMESESHGSRDGFEQAESRLWSRMQDKFPYRTRLLTCTVPENGAASTKSGDHYDDGAVHAWTAFQSGVGYHFYVNGHRITSPPGSSQQAGKSVTTSAWCDISASHASPPFLYEASSSSPSGAHTDPVLPARGSAATSLGPFAPVSIRLPASSLEGSMYGCTARAEWLYDKAWFGDRCLGIVLPPKEAAEVLRWNVRNALPPARDGASAPDLSTPARSSALHIEVVVDDAAVAAPAGASAVESGSAVRGQVGAQQGLRLGLYSASRGAFFATVWEKTAQAGTTAATVAGLDGVQVCVRVLSGSSVRSDRADTSMVVSDHPAGDGWHRVHYELLNTSSETVHLTSISIANGDRSRTLRLCVGAIAVYQAAPQMNTMHNEEDSTAEASRLRAGGPRVWKLHATHFTGRGGEHVLALHDAEAVFAEVRAQYGTSSTVVLFASVSALAADCRSTHSESEEKATAHVTPLDLAHEGGHHMYIGQYSVDPVDKTIFNDALLVPLSLPAERVVTQVFYYTVPNGY